ncbi:MAG: ribosome maturation factor RimP [Cellvibrionales bacterium TMED47]|nr:ribosome maturation factor RimP [Porticoccaceae bacterium]RPG84479.1 MAG: ribosome maturation factor RimP [Cellvibrionales bacterium TMED47]
MSSGDQVLKQLLQPVVEAMDCELWGLELQMGGKAKLLRIFIDRDEEVGVGVDDCERVSRQASAVLDVEDVIPGEYILEVSSPGMDRPLYELDHYARYLGEEISLRLRFPYEGRRNYKGRLKAIEGDEIVVVVTDNEFLFPVEGIEKANLVPQF